MIFVPGARKLKVKAQNGPPIITDSASGRVPRADEAGGVESDFILVMVAADAEEALGDEAITGS